MLLQDFITAIERVAPKELAEAWDNPGLLIGPESRQIHHVLVALDCTPEVAQEAKERGCELVLTHHPLFFQPVRHILQDDPQTAAAYALCRRGIGLYAAHTNLDSAEGGVNDVLAGLFGLTGISPFGDGMGRIGMLQKAVTLQEFVADTDRLLGSRARYAGDPDAVIARVAVLGGAGASVMEQAMQAGADVLLTGELKHHEALNARSMGMPVVAAGHYETENTVLLPWIRRLQGETNDVQYHIACSGVNPFA